jgi:O-antigen/teichoic acid export membrane protein
VFFIEPAFALAFPKYLPGVRSAQILVIATSLVALIPLGTDYLVSIHQQKRLLLITPFSLLFNLIANITLVQLHFGIAGVAFVTMLTNGLVAGYLWKRVTVHLPNGGGMQDLFSLFMGFLVCNLVVWPLEVGLSAFGFAGWPGAGLKAGLFAVVYLAALGWFLSTREWVRMDLRRLARMRAQAMDSTKV